MTFWLALVQSDVEFLSVTTLPQTDQSWLFAQVTISGSRSGNIIFEGTRGISMESDIAIDDLSVTQGACSVSYHCLVKPMHSLPVFAQNAQKTERITNFSHKTQPPTHSYMVGSAFDIFILLFLCLLAGINNRTG